MSHALQYYVVSSGQERPEAVDRLFRSIILVHQPKLMEIAWNTLACRRRTWKIIFKGGSITVWGLVYSLTFVVMLFTTIVYILALNRSMNPG